MKYRSITNSERIIEATQWFKNGDHPLDKSVMIEADPEKGIDEPFLSEGKVVRRFRRPDVDDDELCDYGHKARDHGWIDQIDDRTVCPGDYVITAKDGTYYPMKSSIFEQIYELVPGQEK